jgi:hypothetical protein
MPETDVSGNPKQTSSSSSQYASIHQQKYHERLKIESEMEMVQADEALAKSLQERENQMFADHAQAVDVRNSIQHPANAEDGVRDPIRTGYTDRLIGNEVDDAGNRVRNPSRIWSIFSRRAISGSSESLLPSSSTSGSTFPARLASVWLTFLSILKTYYGLIISLIGVVMLLVYIISQRD